MSSRDSAVRHSGAGSQSSETTFWSRPPGYPSATMREREPLTYWTAPPLSSSIASTVPMTSRALLRASVGVCWSGPSSPMRIGFSPISSRPVRASAKARCAMTATAATPGTRARADAASRVHRSCAAVTCRSAASPGASRRPGSATRRPPRADRRASSRRTSARFRTSVPGTGRAAIPTPTPTATSSARSTTPVRTSPTPGRRMPIATRSATSAIPAIPSSSSTKRR